MRWSGESMGNFDEICHERSWSSHQMISSRKAIEMSKWLSGKRKCVDSQDFVSDKFQLLEQRAASDTSGFLRFLRGERCWSEEQENAERPESCSHEHSPTEADEEVGSRICRSSSCWSCGFGGTCPTVKRVHPLSNLGQEPFIYCLADFSRQRDFPPLRKFVCPKKCWNYQRNLNKGVVDQK